MPSALDLRIQAITAALTGAGGAMMTVPFRQHGHDVPMIAVAPPALTHYFDYFCAQHGDTPFIVAGDERLSFAQAHHAAGRCTGMHHASLVSH